MYDLQLRGRKQEKQRKAGKRIRVWAAVLCLLAGLITAGAVCESTTGTGTRGEDRVLAAEGEKAVLRLISTSDLHGQASTTSYETGSAFETGSLAKAYTLIKEARSESTNSMTFDTGDSLYDYATEYIFAHRPDLIQPIYRAMALVGYDAVTLGNHDFDYGLDYLQKQLASTGMQDKVVVSNVYSSTTKDYIWKPYVLEDKSIVTTDGQTKTIKVGIIGETIPTLTTKTEDYAGRLSTTDIQVSVKARVKTLKSKGADVIIVLAHSGLGPKDPEPMYKSVVYALTKIKGIDAILCGHEHNCFPSTDPSSKAYYELPGVDAKTGLVNGVCVVMPGNRGQAVGIADLTLTFADDGSAAVTKTQGSVRKVTAETAADETINSVYGSVGREMTAAAKEQIGQLADGEQLQDAYGLVEDTSVIQLLNDAKTAWAMRYVANSKPEYVGEPVVACSNYSTYGDNNTDDYLNIKGSVTAADLERIEEYNQYIAVYEITGAQLKKLVEWSAGAYKTTDAPVEWNAGTRDALIASVGLSGTVKANWLTDWSNFQVFDGIEYTIDTSVKPHYNLAGTKTGKGWRVSNLTINGKKVTSGMKILLVCDRITSETTASRGLLQTYIKRGYERSQTVLHDYLRKLSDIEPVDIATDGNWALTGGKVTSLPHIVLAPKTTVETNNGVQILITATASSGIASLSYLNGSYSADAPDWAGAQTVAGKSFTVYANGLYTVLAVDNLGQRTTAKIRVSNFNTGILQIPTIATYTNRKSQMTGTAEPGGDLHVTTEAGISYTFTVGADGTFACTLPQQPALSTLRVYVTDNRGRSSSTVLVKVKRTGPNEPTVDQVTNKSTTITGETNDTYVTVYAQVGSRVYLAKTGGYTWWRHSEKYLKSRKYSKVALTIADGSYTMEVPHLMSGSKMTVYSIDSIGRVSHGEVSYVTKVAPDVPVPGTSYSMTDRVVGRVPNTEADVPCTVHVALGGAVYEGTADAEGYFAVTVPNLTANAAFTVMASDSKDGAERDSFLAKGTVKSLTSYLKNHETGIELAPLTDTTQVLTGMAAGGSTLSIVVNGTTYTAAADESGSFTWAMPQTYPVGTVFTVLSYNARGALKDAAQVSVTQTPPAVPVLVTPAAVTADTTSVTLTTNMACTMNVKIGKKTFSSDAGVQDPATGLWTYTVEISGQKEGDDLKIWAAVGDAKSIALKMTVLAGAAPVQNEPAQTGTETTQPENGIVVVP